MARQPEPNSEAELHRMRDEAERLRRDLELLNDPETICGFGQMAFDGDGVEQDYIAAANWFRIAAERGSSKAQHNLALMCENGQGVLQDYSQAAKWYHMAAEQGNPGSQNNLGSLYETGEGVTRDYAGRMISMLNYALTSLTRDWQDIATEDKGAVARLAAYESFPEWALPLKHKYIDEQRASCEAAEAAFRVMKDRIDREKAEADYDYTINAKNWIAHLTPPELAHWESKPQSEKDWWYAKTKPEDRGRIPEPRLQRRQVTMSFSTRRKLLAASSRSDWRDKLRRPECACADAALQPQIKHLDLGMNPPRPNLRAALDAAVASCLHFVGHRRQ